MKMGLFNFLKSKQSQDSQEKLSVKFFPNGEKDVNAGTDELLFILRDKVDRETAKDIFVKSFAASVLSPQFFYEFNEQRLLSHLSGYCLQYFSPDQVRKLYSYLSVLNSAIRENNMSPAEVTRDGGLYSW